eukprot:TRINITY_DN94052_c0_g1_i1.p1 TRINITY_DN94052_c0_g1~~TRINITY_DN94052_c0_g1_i1.p1  ORF type:complete len:425 (-),score=74.86 TRINITY_DN94052_c0_g1_i1:337-1611(-)
MPVYEEKLILPLAVHFTQEHIKTHFRDGHVVEDTVKQITVVPAGTDDYDLLLRAPFPNIEIIRWRAPGEQGSSTFSEPATHWFTLDNRRLYCLQRAAAKYWPRRVAAEVEILYADSGSILKKYDSTTQGISVTISPSCKHAPLFRWDWRKDFRVEMLQGTERGRQSVELLEAEDNKRTVAALLDLPGSDLISSYAHLLSSSGDSESPKGSKPPSVCPTPSTAVSEDLETCSNEADATSHTEEWKPKLSPSKERSQSSNAGKPSKSQSSQKWKVKEQSEQERPNQDPRTSGWDDSWADWNEWHDWNDEGQEWASVPKAKAKAKAKAVSSKKLENEAIAQIKAQLADDERQGYVWVEEWNERFLPHLGTLRTFLESRPDKFVVTPGKGKSYRVEACEKSNDKKCRKNGRPVQVRRWAPVNQAGSAW